MQVHAGHQCGHCDGGCAPFAVEGGGQCLADDAVERVEAVKGKTLQQKVEPGKPDVPLPAVAGIAFQLHFFHDGGQRWKDIVIRHP